MCCIIKVSQKLLDKNKFACSKIILWIHYSWMYNGKPTFSKKSCLQQITQPTPPPPSEVKRFRTSFMKRTPVVWFLQGASPKSNHIILSFWLFSYGKFDCSTSQFKPHYSATTLTGELGRRLSNHNVFWKQRFLNLFCK